jgi:hypothetical protein
MGIDYYCTTCKRHISEGDVRTVRRVSRDGAFGVVIHREPCGGDVLYYEPEDECFYVPIPAYRQDVSGDTKSVGL